MALSEEQYQQATKFTWQDVYFLNLTVAGKLAFIYILGRVSAGYDYISTERMAEATGLPEVMCDNFLTQFAADRELPRMTVLEEQRG